MFGKAKRAVKLVDLVCLKPQGGFSSYESRASLAALEKISESMKNRSEDAFKDLLILDKLNSTTYSETVRVLNKQTKSFYSQKTIYLEDDDSAALKQIELLIKQHKQNNSLLINYKKDAKYIQVIKVLSEIQKTTLGDFSEYYLNNKGQFETETMKEYAWQLFEILLRARSLDATCYDLSLQNIFIDYKDNKIKLHDYSDLRYFSELYAGLKSNPVSYYLDIVLHTIAKMTNPPVTISNGDHARAYMKEKYPEFMREFRDIEAFAGSIHTWWPSDESQNKSLLSDLESRKSSTLPFDIGFNQFLLEKIKKANPDSIKLVEAAINQQNIGIQANLKTTKESGQGSSEKNQQQQQQQSKTNDEGEKPKIDQSGKPTQGKPQVKVQLSTGSTIVILLALIVLGAFEEEKDKDSKSKDEKRKSSSDMIPITPVIVKKEEKKRERKEEQQVRSVPVAADSSEKKQGGTAQLVMFGLIVTLVTLGFRL